VSLANLNYIGHCGNFIIIDGKNNYASSNIPPSTNLYNDMFAASGVFGSNKDVSTIEQTFNTILPDEYHIKMLTFGLDTIFNAAQASPFAGGLESLGLLKYIKLETAAANIRLPTPLSLIPKGRGV
jgi:hypothetical protein